MADLIDGRAVARKLDEETKAAIDAMVAAGAPRPGLAVLLVGNDPASEVYVGRKIKKCAEVGIDSSEHRLPAETTQDELLALIARLNADPRVHGILCQVPLPAHIDTGLCCARSRRARTWTVFIRSTSAVSRPAPEGSSRARRSE